MIKLMIDSGSDMNKEEADNLGIIFMPIEVRFASEEFLDGVNLLPKEFYEKLAVTKELPKTSQINPFRYEEAFEEATKNGDQLIVITLSSGLSGTYSNAVQASERFKGKVFVVDSLNACSGERILGLYALDLIKKGLSASEIVDKLNEQKKKIKVIAIIDTLKYLKMGGRISALSAVIGGALSVKPLIAVVDGKIETIGKAMGSKKAYKLLMEKINEHQIDFDMPSGFIWSGFTMDSLESFKAESEAMWEGHDIPAYILGSTIGTHIGHGAVGIAFFAK